MFRPHDDRVVAGVALAVANRLGMAPGAVRLVWFVLGFFGGVGILLYIAGWLLIPEEGAPTSVAEDAIGRLSDSTAWIGVALIVIAAVMLVTLGGWVRADLAWAVALLAVGILLYRGQLDSIFDPDRSSVAETDDEIDEEIEAAMAEVEADVPSDGDEPPIETLVEPAPAARPRRMRERSILGRLTIGTAFVAIGIMALLDSTDVARPDFTHYMALFVGIIGLGLLVGSVIGRSRGLIFLGVVLVPILLASSVVSARFAGGWGDPEFIPRSVDQIQDSYSLTGGDLEIDLTRVDLGGATVEIEGDVGFGRLLVIVPEGVGVSARTHVGFGDIQILGDHASGVDVDRSVFIDGDGLLVLDLDVGFGELEIREVSR
jgi:phage shock protein PspC (stress-responsive transcriptional regulator)